VALTDAFQEPLAAQVAQTLAQHAASPRTVAETAAIKSLCATDLIAVVKSVSAVRNTKSGKEVAIVELIDGSLTQSRLTAIVSMSVFGCEEIDMITRGQHQPLVCFNLVAKYDNKALQINHWENDVVDIAPDSPRTAMLLSTAADLQRITNTETLTSSPMCSAMSQALNHLPFVHSLISHLRTPQQLCHTLSRSCGDDWKSRRWLTKSVRRLATAFGSSLITSLSSKQEF
jgi:hypothetical protein